MQDHISTDFSETVQKSSNWLQICPTFPCTLRLWLFKDGL